MKKLIFAVFILLSITTFGQEKIRILNVAHDKQGATTYTAQYRVPLPANLSGIPHAAEIVNAYKSVYRIETLDTVNNIVYAVFTIQADPLPLYKVVDNITTEQPNMPEDYYAPLLAQYAELEAGLAAFQLLPSDNIIGKKLINNSWVDSQ